MVQWYYNALPECISSSRSYTISMLEYHSTISKTNVAWRPQSPLYWSLDIFEEGTVVFKQPVARTQPTWCVYILQLLLQQNVKQIKIKIFYYT